MTELILHSNKKIKVVPRIYFLTINLAQYRQLEPEGLVRIEPRGVYCIFTSTDEGGKWIPVIIEDEPPCSN